MRLIQVHRPPIEKRVRANLMGVESEALKSKIVCVNGQEEDDMGAYYTACGGGIVGVISADWGGGVGTIFLRWRKRWSAAETVFLCSRSVAYMMVYYPMIQFL